MLECRSILNGGLIKSYIEERRKNPGKHVYHKHLPKAIEDVALNERKVSTRRLLELLIMAQDNGSIEPDLLQAYSRKAEVAAIDERAKDLPCSNEGQDVRLAALAILFLGS